LLEKKIQKKIEEEKTRERRQHLSLSSLSCSSILTQEKKEEANTLVASLHSFSFVLYALKSKGWGKSNKK
jgi:hypothetical protein